MNLFFEIQFWQLPAGDAYCQRSRRRYRSRRLPARGAGGAFNKGRRHQSAGYKGGRPPRQGGEGRRLGGGGEGRHASPPEPRRPAISTGIRAVRSAAAAAAAAAAAQ